MRKTARIPRAQLAVPAAGPLHEDEFEVNARPVASSSTIAVHGDVKIKKLNSGG